MKNESKRQNAFIFDWKRKPVISTTGVGDFYPMRGWQKEAFDKLRDKSLMILNAPMGSGKSWLMCLLSAYKMKANSSLRSIIAVPQTIIAPGFADANLKMPDGEKIHWHVGHNLCGKDSSKGSSKVEYVINWLLQNHENLNDKVLICSHATLVYTYKKLKAEGQLHLLTDLLIWVDEAHHVKNVAMEDIEGGVISNGIGDLVKYLLNQTTRQVQVGLTTASFFRGDRCSLLTQAMGSQFEKASLPYDTYLQSMEHLESFSFDFLLCGQDYTRAIGNLAKERKGKDIIYVPHPKSRNSTGDKYQEVKDILAEYQKIYGGELIGTSDGLNILQSSETNFKILDLVDEDGRIAKKEFLNSEDLKKRPEALDVIIALGMFKEGANWIWADRSVIVGERASLVEILQMMGRLLRDAKDKRHVEVIQLLPFSLDQQSDSFRDNLNNYLKAIFASLILEDVLNPTKITTPFRSKTEDNFDEGNGGNKNITTMSDLIPDESTRIAVIDDVVKRLITISDTNKKEGRDMTALYEEYQDALPEILQAHGITTQVKDIGDKIWGMLVRRSLKMQGIAVEDINFDIVKITHPLEGLLRYTSGACGYETLAQLREAIRSLDEENNARWETNYRLLEKHTEQHGNCRVNKNYEITVDGKIVKLGSWYSDQKRNFAYLSQNKQKRLQKLPGFIAKKFIRNKNLSIDEWINLFISVSKRLQTPLIPNTHVENGFNLGAWIQYIRKNEEWKKLTSEQKQLLFDHNFKLSPFGEEWEEASVLAMSQFELREGHTIPKTGHKESVFHKGVWYTIRLDTLRNKIRKTSGDIPEGLTKIPNFLTELQSDRTEFEGEKYLETGLALYKKFMQREGHAFVPELHIEDDFDLFKWKKRLRTKNPLRYVENVPDSFKQELIAIDPYFFSEYPVQDFFYNIKPKIEDYIQEHRHAMIPQGHVCVDGFLLGEKISDLRERRKNLAKPISDYLDSLGDKWAWNAFESVQIKKAKELIAYFEQNRYEQETLPKDIRELKSNIKKALLKYPSLEPYKKHIEELAPGIFDEPKDESYLALLSYMAREGHACPPIKHIENGKRIGNYVSNIRQDYKNGHLSIEERAKYESLKGWRWNAQAQKAVQQEK